MATVAQHEQPDQRQDKPKRDSMLHLRVPTDLRVRLNTQAAAEDRYPNEVCIDALEAYLATHGKAA